MATLFIVSFNSFLMVKLLGKYSCGSEHLVNHICTGINLLHGAYSRLVNTKLEIDKHENKHDESFMPFKFFSHITKYTS